MKALICKLLQVQLTYNNRAILCQQISTYFHFYKLLEMKTNNSQVEG